MKYLKTEFRDFLQGKADRVIRNNNNKRHFTNMLVEQNLVTIYDDIAKNMSHHTNCITFIN